MYHSSLAALAILVASALAAHPHRRSATLPSRATASNTPQSPDFMALTNETMSAWTRAGCGHNSDGTENIFFPDLQYGKNNHALVVSFMLGRDLQPNEQLDMSFFGTSTTGVDQECAAFQYTASPDAGEGGPTLKANQCYTPSVPVTCFNLWRTQ